MNAVPARLDNSRNEKRVFDDNQSIRSLMAFSLTLRNIGVGERISLSRRKHLALKILCSLHIVIFK